MFAAEQNNHKGPMAIFRSEEATVLGEREQVISFLFLFFWCSFELTVHPSLKVFKVLAVFVDHWKGRNIDLCKRIILVINELHPFLEINTAGASLNTAILSNSIR